MILCRSYGIPIMEAQCEAFRQRFPMHQMCRECQGEEMSCIYIQEESQADTIEAEQETKPPKRRRRCPPGMSPKEKRPT